MGEAVAAIGMYESAIRAGLTFMRCIECGGLVECERIQPCGAGDGLGPEGTLRRRECAREYPIVAGSPVMLRRVPSEHGVQADPEADVRRRTAESFAYEWEHFGELRRESERNFREYIRPHEPASLKGSLVLDVGTGSGRHSYEAHRLGARVVAVDVGEAIHVARRNLPSDVVTVQADAEELPFEDEAFDLVMAIGVLHHLPDPRRALKSLARLVRPGGHIQIYVYWIPSRRWHRFLLRLVGAARRVTTRMPRPLLRTLCYPLAAVLYTMFVLPYRLSRRIRGLDRVAVALPLKAYADYPFRVCVNDQFDRFSAPLEWRFTAEEVDTMLGKVGFTDTVVLDNHGWIGSGRRPLASSRAHSDETTRNPG
jgi:SAM-dependent methyltransferase